MAPDAVIAYHSALEFYGRAYSIHQQCVFLTEHETRAQIFRGVRFIPAKISNKLQNKMLGVVTVEHLGCSIKITSRERTLIDVLDRIDLSGGLEEVWRSLEMFEYFELNAVVEYALALKNVTTIALLGFFLEQHREVFTVPDLILKKLKKFSPKQPRYLFRKITEKNTLLADWNLLVPSRLVTKSWDDLL